MFKNGGSISFHLAGRHSPLPYRRRSLAVSREQGRLRGETTAMVYEAAGLTVLCRYRVNKRRRPRSKRLCIHDPMTGARTFLSYRRMSKGTTTTPSTSCSPLPMASTLATPPSSSSPPISQRTDDRNSDLGAARHLHEALRPCGLPRDVRKTWL